MIFITEINGERCLINHRLIETAREKPDTTLTMTNGKIYIIRETMEELYKIVQDYERSVSVLDALSFDKE